MPEERFMFEFCSDTTDQDSEIAGMTYGIQLDLSKVRNVCRVCNVRARVIKNGSYYKHIFEDGSLG